MHRSTEPADHRTLLREIARRAMIEHRLAPDFPSNALQELARLAPAAPADVRDLRDLPWCSIDNDDSMDLDQLTVSVGDGAGTRILVAVADVDRLVPKDCAIDHHARQNTTSVYTAAEIFPMLPERLSTDLTSLAFAQDRAAIVIDMTVLADGTVNASDVYLAAVRNRAKLAYNSVASWLDGEGPAPPAMSGVPGLDEQLRVQDRVASAMNQWRHAQGALELETIETRPVFDGHAVQSLQVERKNRAKAIIENFMIAANGVTANFLADRRVPSLRRIVRTPARWDRIVDLAARHGETLPPQPDGRALQGFLTRQKERDPLRFADLSLAVIKLLGPGEYVVERPGESSEGHFGLAVRDYSHSTAPNRRFPDLVTQRLIKAALAGRPVPYTEDELAALARHATLQAENASRVERQVRKSAAALLLSGRTGERFDAIVTGASAKGTWVRTLAPAAEGKVVRGAEGLDVGDRVRVELVATDVERGFVDFARAEGTP